LDRKLTLVSAPAGFGKTTLVSEWAHEVGAPLQVAWLSLDEGDNDLTRFLAYLIAALRTIEASFGKGALIALQSPGIADATAPPPAEIVLTSLINEITALPGRIILVLDDYHLIEAQPVHDALAFLLEHLPPPPGGLHLVIATREDPHLPLARLRARGQLTELRATDLRFTSSEAAEFLSGVMGLDLSAGDVAALERRTEGWIAGLQLAALALQGPLSMQGRQDASSLIQSFTGSHRYVLDYLIEEVLEQQPEGIQTFLLQTAVLDRLTGPLCDAVRFGHTEAPSTADNGQAILETLDRANLFIIPLDEERRWYRYHHLFVGLLRQRLRQTQPDRVPTLHLQASQWYQGNGFADEAVEHALRAEDFERAAGLLEDHAEAMWTRGEHAKLRRWLAGLPGDVVFRKPLLGVFHAWFLFAKGSPDAGEQYLQAAEQVLDSSSDRTPAAMLPEQDALSDSDRQKLRGRAAVIRAFMASYLGDVPAIIAHARQALQYLPKQDLTWRSTAAIALGDALGFKGDMAAAYQARLEAAEASAAAGSTVFSMLAYIKVAITTREQGQLQRTLEICQQQIQLAAKNGLSRGSVAGCLLAIWGEVLVELGDMEGALAQARRGVELAERGGDWSLFGWSCLCLLRVLFSAGETAGAQEMVQKMENMARESILPPWITNQMAAWQTQLWVAQEKLDAASEWVEARGLLSDGEPEPLPPMDYFALIEYVLLARILIAQRRLDGATRLLPGLLEAAEAGDRRTRVIEILNLQALAFQAGGHPTQAMTALERALTLAEPGGFVQIFVDEGAPMARLLHQAAAGGMMPDYAAKLLASFETTDGRRPTTGPPLSASSVVHRPPASARVSPALVEPLSERELEVLQLVAEGLTNREIAARLFLSLNTVKAHTRNIYGKLGVNSRTQAVARARALGVLAYS
jgi:LuxR family maltose regulon positive regulatory protein